MAKIDIRGENLPIDEIFFSDNSSIKLRTVHLGLSEVKIAEISPTGSVLRIENQTECDNLIEALLKASSLGWFKK
jgi:hypothetical protein